MEVSFDGMRRQATRNMNTLYSEIQHILELNKKDELCCYDFSSLGRRFNDAALSVDMFNILQDPDGKSYKSLDIDIQQIDEEYLQ